MSRALAPRTRTHRWYALLVGLLASIALCASTVTASASSASTGPRILFQNANSGYFMSVPGDNTQTAGEMINQYHLGPFPDQFWYEEPSASHHGYFYIQPQQNYNLCLTYVPNNYNANITLEPCGANAANGNPDTQLWTDSPYYQYHVLSTIQGWSLSVPGASTAEATRLNIYPPGPSGPYVDQLWTLHYA